MRLAVLISGSGTNLQAILDAVATDPDFGGKVVVVGSDRADATGLDRARSAGVATFTEPLDAHPDRPSWEAALIRRLQEHEADAIVLAGFMRLVSGTFLGQWPDRVINTHPSILPAFRGGQAVAEALAHGVKLTGTTVHFVDEQVDHGPIIAQVPVAVYDHDDEHTLHERIKVAEHLLFPWCVKQLCNGRLTVDGRVVRIDPLAGPVPRP